MSVLSETSNRVRQRFFLPGYSGGGGRCSSSPLDRLLVPRGAGKMELRGELTGRDGLKQQLRVCCQPQGDLRGLLSGLVVLREQVSALLGPLVQQESGGGAGDRAGAGDEEEDIDEEDEDEKENHVNAKAGPNGPPLKRTKTNS